MSRSARRGRYPKYDGERRLDKRAPKRCAAACELVPIRLVDVQVSWFRGDDEVLAVCADHLKLARRAPAELLRLARKLYSP